jgi:hypothetical protein
MCPHYSHVTSNGHPATAPCLQNGIQLVLCIVDTFSKSQFADATERDDELGAHICEPVTPL